LLLFDNAIKNIPDQGTGVRIPGQYCHHKSMPAAAAAAEIDCKYMVSEHIKKKCTHTMQVTLVGIGKYFSAGVLLYWLNIMYLIYSVIHFLISTKIQFCAILCYFVLKSCWVYCYISGC